MMGLSVHLNRTWWFYDDVVPKELHPKNLCSVMTMLMMLAFLIDQVQQLCCKVYQQARKHVGTLRRLFEKIQNRIDIAAWNSWHHLLTFIGDPASRPPPIGSGYIIA